MIKRADWASRTSYTDRESPFDPASARSAGMMFAAARSHSEHSAPDPTALASPNSPAVFDLADLNGRNGSLFGGLDQSDQFGCSVSDAGDVNGDGFADIVIGAKYANNDGGESYVVFGTADGFGESFDLASLDGTNGFRLVGRINQATGYGSNAGYSVSSAGDFNGDGFDDVMVEASSKGAGRYVGETYIIYGKADGFAASINLNRLAPGEGVTFTSDERGVSVSSAGDVNGDGFDDVIVGNVGRGYVVFGAADGVPPEIDLEQLDGTDGFSLVAPGDLAVSSAGDINGDGFDDMLIGVPAIDSSDEFDVGAAYVVFGHAGAFTAGVDLAALDGADGFRITGLPDESERSSGASAGDGFDDYDELGRSVSAAGDVNGDGYDDIIIGAPGVNTSNGQDTGESYVVFGRAGGFGATVDLTTLDGTNGFRLDGSDKNGNSGFSVSSAGDLNGDGFDDLIIGAPYAGPDRISSYDRLSGASYVVFGRADGFDATLDLGTLDGTNGFRLDGIDGNDQSGSSVSSAGDVDGDGFDDILIGAPSADRGGDFFVGEAYLLYGRAPTEAVTRIGSAADQAIRGGDFDDTLRGKQGDDVLIGSDGDDWLRGGRGADELVGGAGADRMNGGSGHDSISGGQGADAFVIASTAAEDWDEILDFVSGEDGIVLGGDTFPLDEGALAEGSFVIGNAAADADDRLIYDDTTGNLFFDADGTGAQAQILIATLTGAPPLAATDITVV